MTDQRREPDGPQITPTQQSMPESKPGPESKPTLQIPKADIISAQLAQVLASLGQHRTETSDALGSLRIVLDRVVHEGIEVNTRMTRFEVRLESLEDRANTTSIKVSGASQVDLEHEAKLGLAIAKTQELENAIHETRSIAESTATEIAKQSDYMGLGKKGIVWLGSKDGRAAMVQLALALYAAWEFLKHGVMK